MCREAEITHNTNEPQPGPRNRALICILWKIQGKLWVEGQKCPFILLSNLNKHTMETSELKNVDTSAVAAKISATIINILSGRLGTSAVVNEALFNEIKEKFSNDELVYIAMMHIIDATVKCSKTDEFKALLKLMTQPKDEENK